MNEKIKALYDTAKNWFKRGLNDKAIEDFTKCIELKPDFTDAYYERGLIYKQLKEYDKAIVDFKSVIEIDPNHVLAYYHLSLVFGVKDEPDNAIDAANKAIKADPYFPNAYHSRGVAWMAKKKLKSAIKDFDAALRLAPNGLSYYWRGQAYYEKGKHDQAVDDFIEAMKCDIYLANRPYNHPLYYGVAAYARNQADTAITNLTRAIIGGVKLAKVYYFLARSYAFKGETENAIQDLKEALNIDPDYKDAKELLEKLK